MDAFEIQGLAIWFKSYFKEIRQRIDALHNILAHNASQQNQQPIESALESLITYLKGVRLEELNLQQIHLLERLEIAELLGPEGAKNVAALVKTASYDPASVEQKINIRISNLNQANQKLTAVSTGLDELGFVPAEYENDSDRVLVRVIFRRDASIENVKDWKSSAEDWYQIIRGVGLAIGEAPENTKVLGASKGSLILILSATCTLTAALAIISKNISGIAKDVISVQSEIESLRQKKMLTETIKTELEAVAARRREEGIAAIEAELGRVLQGEINGENKNALDKSIKKLVDFGEKGGDLDFVEPPVNEDEMDVPDLDKRETQLFARMAETRRLIKEYQEVREDIKQLVIEDLSD